MSAAPGRRIRPGGDGRRRCSARCPGRHRVDRANVPRPIRAAIALGMRSPPGGCAQTPVGSTCPRSRWRRGTLAPAAWALISRSCAHARPDPPGDAPGALSSGGKGAPIIACGAPRSDDRHRNAARRRGHFTQDSCGHALTKLRSDPICRAAAWRRMRDIPSGRTDGGRGGEHASSSVVRACPY